MVRSLGAVDRTLTTAQSDAKAASADSAAATFVANLSRTSPATVAWLQANFEPADGVSLGRETLYKVILYLSMYMGRPRGCG